MSFDEPFPRDADAIEQESSTRALNRAIDDMEAGRMRPWEDFERQFRAKNNLPPADNL